MLISERSLNTIWIYINSPTFHQMHQQIQAPGKTTASHVALDQIFALDLVPQLVLVRRDLALSRLSTLLAPRELPRSIMEQNIALHSPILLVLSATLMTTIATKKKSTSQAMTMAAM